MDVFCPRTQYNNPARSRTHTSPPRVLRTNHKATASRTQFQKLQDIFFLFFPLMAFFLFYLQGVKRGFFRKRKGSRLLRKLKKKACKKVCKWAIKRICRRVPDRFNKLWRKCLNLRNRGCKRVCKWLIG